jgi:hypothetical protein
MSWVEGSPGGPTEGQTLGSGADDEVLGREVAKMGVDLKASSGQRQYEGDSTQLARRRAGKS